METVQRSPPCGALCAGPAFGLRGFLGEAVREAALFSEIFSPQSGPGALLSSFVIPGQN